MKQEPSQFANKVYSLLKTIPKGKVTTYKELAIALDIKAYQAIGQVLRINPYAPKVPCHRVVKTDGSLGGFMGETKGEAITKKIKLLNLEKVKIENNRVVDFENKLYKFK